MNEQKLDIILHELTEIRTDLLAFKSEVNARFDKIETEIVQVKSNVVELKLDVACPVKWPIKNYRYPFIIN